MTTRAVLACLVAASALVGAPDAGAQIDLATTLEPHRASHDLPALAAAIVKGDFAMVLLTNIAGAKAEQAFRTLAEQLYRRFASPQRTP